MNKLIAVVTVAFIVYIIYLANMGRQDHVFFQLVAAVPFGDKIGHFVLIGTLALVVNLALGSPTFHSWRVLGVPILLGTVVVTPLVVAEEFSQLFVASRTFDWIDLICDFIGIAAANWLAYRTRKSNHSEVGTD